MVRILVVDDDARNLRLAVAALEQAGHDVLSAECGGDALEAAIAHTPDLILMDVQMPGMDGIAALRHLRANPGTAALKVVALTALAMKGDRESLLAAGFDGYLQKPIRYKECLSGVAEMLKGASSG